MVDLTELKTTANNMLWLAKHRQADFSAALVIAKLVLPVLRLIEVMEAHRGDRWRTLSEAMRESGRTRNYFEKPLAAAGGRNRLEVWRDEGLADRTEEGIWLISPIKVAEASSTDEDAIVAEEVSDSVSRDDLAARIAADFLACA